MTLRAFMTSTASTKRAPAMSGGKISSTFVANLSGVLVTYPNPPENKGQQRVMQAQGLQGSAIHEFECFTESHTHTDSGVSVTQMPDILINDIVTIDNVNYLVKEVGVWGESSSFGKTMYIYMDKDMG
jgi:hypothetical protein